MSTDAAITALIRYNQARSETKKDAVRAAVTRLTEDPHEASTNPWSPARRVYPANSSTAIPTSRRLLTPPPGPKPHGTARRRRAPSTPSSADYGHRTRPSPTPSPTRRPSSPSCGPPSNSCATNANSTSAHNWQPPPSTPKFIGGCRSTVTGSPPTIGNYMPASMTSNESLLISVRILRRLAERTPKTSLNTHRAELATTEPSLR